MCGLDWVGVLGLLGVNIFAAGFNTCFLATVGGVDLSLGESVAFTTGFIGFPEEWI